MNEAFSLNNKTILITGASSGIGRETAIKCSEAGAKLIITGRDKQRLNETLLALNGQGHISFVCDMLNEKEMNELVSALPGLDGAVHCAAVVKLFPIGFLNEKKINETFHTNFYSVIYLTTKLFKSKKINNNASLVFISSIAGQHPHRGSSMYAASKAAVEAFCRTIALEYSVQKIRANCICPAMVKTPVYEASQNFLTKESLDAHVAKYPLGPGHPDDVANATVFLLSPASKWITGINLIMDGGLLLNY